MKQYTQGTSVYLLAYQVDGSALFFNIGGVSWYFWAITLFAGITILVLGFMKPSRIRYKEEIQEKKVDDKDD
jgi:hypothetical protein